MLPRNGLVLVILLMSAVLLWGIVNQPGTPPQELTYSQFLEAAGKGQVKDVVVDGSIISGKLLGSNGLVGKEGETSTGKVKKETEFRTVGTQHEGFIELMREKGISFQFKEPRETSWVLVLLANLLPILLLVGIWVFFMRSMQMGAGKGMSFGKSKAKLLTEHHQKVTFENVAGIDEARAELQEIIDFLKDPKKFTRLGGRIPKGVLLVGSPGTGKTLLARAIAGEAGVPFFSISGSDFVEMFVGVGASRVRDLFVQGKKNAPCIIFIDEIDAVGRHRGAGMGGGHDEREQTLNQLLVEMDGFESNEGVILIAATNRPDVLDPALLRPGRFDRRVVVPRPDLKGRLGILKVHARKTPLADNVDLEVIARGTPGFSGADLEILVNEAALYAARNNKDVVERDDFEFAKDKVMMGAERRSMLLTEDEKKTTAYHEAGHAMVAKLLKNADPVHKLTIVPRGMALGVMQQLPEQDRHTHSREYLRDQLVVLMGGRAAEQIVFNEMNTGASSDISRATDIARRMVTEWGMSEKLGPVHYSAKEEHVFLGREIGKPREHSESTQVEIDQEVRGLVDGAYRQAHTILTENIDKLHSLAKAAIEHETLNAEQIDAIMRGEELPQPPSKSPEGTATKAVA